MKKILRLISVLVVVCIICLSFSGCNFIASLKEENAVLNKEGNIEFEDNVYIKLDDTDDVYMDYDFDANLTLSEEDEPILVSFFKLDNACDISKDRLFIEDYDMNIYCREDKYEEISEKIDKGFEKEKYIYTYDVYEEESVFDFEYETKVYNLSESELDTVNKVFATAKPITNATEMCYNSDYWVQIYGCTEDLILREAAFDIFFIDDKYYLQKTDEYYNVIVYEVPSNYYEIFEKIIAEFVKNSEY